MGERSSQCFDKVNNVTCAACGVTTYLTMPEAGKLGWDWFKGYLPTRIEFCPRHARSVERNVLFSKSRIKP